MAEWRTIESAPGDGREAIVGVWVCGPDHEPYWSQWFTVFDGGPLGCDGAYGDEPTHFTDAPEPPTTKGEGE